MTGVAVKITDTPSQITDPLPLEIETLVAMVELTVMLILLLVAETVVTHVSEVVISHVTTSPLVNELVL